MKDHISSRGSISSICAGYECTSRKSGHFSISCHVSDLKCGDGFHILYPGHTNEVFFTEVNKMCCNIEA